MAESQYVLRGKKNKAPMVYTIIVLSIIGLTFILYATYAYLGYIRLKATPHISGKIMKPKENTRQSSRV